MKRSLLMATLALSLALPLLAQDTKLEAKVDVNLVLVDVTVTDNRGHHILGLDKDDFIIKENGIAQSVDSIDYFTNRRLLDSPESKAAFKVERVREERYFIIFFHKVLDVTNRPNAMSELMKAKMAAAEFVAKDMLPTDRVAVAGYDVRLKIFSDFTSDKAQLKKALEESVRFGKGITAVPAGIGQASILTNLNFSTMINRTGRIYDAIELLANSVSKVSARKVLILFSPGMAENLSGNSPIPQDDTYYLPMVKALNRSNVTVNAVSLLRGVSMHPILQNLSRVAMETGGEYYFDPVNYKTPVRLIENVNNGYYMLTYYSRKPSDKHGYQKINVSLRNPEFRVKARDGYPF